MWATPSRDLKTRDQPLWDRMLSRRFSLLLFAFLQSKFYASAIILHSALPCSMILSGFVGLFCFVFILKTTSVSSICGKKDLEVHRLKLP